MELPQKAFTPLGTYMCATNKQTNDIKTVREFCLSIPALHDSHAKSCLKMTKKFSLLHCKAVYIYL